MALQMWVLSLALLGLGSALVCPDGGMCEDRNTCCKNTVGGYGCCPLPHAECCSDHLHCCFEGTLCDLVHKACVNKTASLPWVTRLPTKQAWIEPQLAGSVKAVICPDQESECPDDTTCCELPDHSWGCCPLAKAVCCDDKRHCCPEGTQCDLVHSKCVSASLKSFPLLEKLPARRRRRDNAALHESPAPPAGSVPCPDKKTKCPSGTSCCPSGKGGYNCCPFPDAVCCSDYIHCCPTNTTCDLELQICRTGPIHTPLMKKTPALPIDGLYASAPPPAGSVQCPDGETKCPSDTSCCPSGTGDYNCCFYPDAVCCSDNVHCCPTNTTCDLELQICRTGPIHMPLRKKTPALPIDGLYASAPPPAGSVQCPDGETKCPSDTSCCPSGTGDYNCCFYPDAVCCSDNIHCCPSNTTCDLELQICRTGPIHMPLMKKTPALPNDVKCPDQSTSCPDETTCCKMSNSSYGCCPMPNAVCCSDLLHCCPEGTQCDLVHSTCSSARGDVTMASKIPAAVTEVTAARSKVGAVPCNDSAACADGSTCCKSPAGEWACCPLAEAVCCEDHLHCCPHGTVCNLEASTCDDPSGGGAVTPLLRKEPVFALTTDNTKCDRSTSCPGKSTCCKTASGDWACCPLHQAVCCDDHVHCCPHGTVCNLEAQTCDDPSGARLALPWVEKVAALTSELQDEKCDKQTMCPGGTTCCKKNSGQWACCPLPQAVCCSDHEHCCPKGYKCNVAEQTCDKPEHPSLPWLQKVPALQLRPSSSSVSSSVSVSGPAQSDRNMCDSQTSCPKDTTCCFMDQTHKWGCCPLPKAVCCNDGNHCCPSGHTCEPHRSSCSRGLHVLPWFTKVSARTEPTANDDDDADAVTDVKCDDKSSCASGTTCCKLPTGEWGCCPLVKAVCCADHEHCCPQGYTCNMQTGTCEKKMHDVLVHTVPQIAVVRSEPRDDEVVPCGGTGGEFSCSREETCCRTSSSEWTCCPSPQATCCADAQHCCPLGYSCDLQSGGCSLKTPPTWDALLGDRKRHSAAGRL